MNAHNDRLLGTVFYEEFSPLEMVRDAELGIRASEMLDCLEDAMTIIFYCDKAHPQRHGPHGSH